MVLYDKFKNPISSGDIIKFENNNLYVVFFQKNGYVIQNITKYTQPLKLDRFAKYGIVPAIRINNITSIN